MAATSKAKQRQSGSNKSYFETYARSLVAKKARKKRIRDAKVKEFAVKLGPIYGPDALTTRSRRRTKRPLTAAGEARRDRRMAKGIASRNRTINERDIGRN